MQPIATTRSSAGILTGRLGVWWVLASEIVIFGGLLASYIMLRISHAAWAVEASYTSTPIGTFNTFVLLTSSLSAVLAHNAMELGDGKKAARLLHYTIAGGGLFLCVKAYEWAGEISEGFTISSSGFWSFYYTATGIHAMHVIAGMILMAIVARDAAKGLNVHRVELVGIYWHFVDLVWIFLFPLVYIAK